MTEEQKKDDRQHLILELEYKNGEKYSMPVYVNKEGLRAMIRSSEGKLEDHPKVNFYRKRDFYRKGEKKPVFSFMG